MAIVLKKNEALLKVRITLQYKIAFLITLIIAVIFSGVYVYLNESLKNFFYERIRSDMSQRAVLVKDYFENFVKDNLAVEEMDELADKMGQLFGTRVTIIAPGGVVWGDSELDGNDLKRVENHLLRPEVQMALNKGTGESRRFSSSVNKEMLYVAFTFSFSGQPQDGNSAKNVIRLAIPLTDIHVMSNNLKRLLAVCLGLAFVLSVMFSFFLSRLISVPVKKLSRVAQSIAEGDFGQKALEHRNDEIGDLAHAINHMSEQIRLRMDDVLSNQSKLEAVLLSMFDGVLVVDAGGRIVLLNESLKKILEVKDDPRGFRPLEFIRHVDVQELVDKALNSPTGVESRELHLHLVEEKVLLVHATAVYRAGKIDGAVLVFHDISDLRRLEKIRQEFVANVSHELRTPVATIKGYAETLLDGAMDDKENARDFLQIIHTDADRLAKLINDLLDLARIESGKLNLSLKSWSIDPIVDRAIDLLRKQADDKAIVIKKDIPSHLPNVYVDETAIAQVLLNLIENAVKYTNDGGSIIISAKEFGESILVSIKDTGMGIPAEDIPRIFERFYRVDKARSRQIGGTGLGLSIVKHIVLAHNGDVSVESQPGKGSTFSFTILKA